MTSPVSPAADPARRPESTPAAATSVGCGHSRRALLGGTVMFGSALALAACSGGGEATAVPSATGTATDAMALSDLPVGGEAQVQVAEAQVILYRPDENTVLAYSAICTHAGCTVQKGDEEQFHCPCHDSIFSATDGSVVSGPAPRALERFAAEIDGDRVMVNV